MLIVKMLSHEQSTYSVAEKNVVVAAENVARFGSLHIANQNSDALFII